MFIKKGSTITVNQYVPTIKLKEKVAQKLQRKRGNALEKGTTMKLFVWLVTHNKNKFILVLKSYHEFCYCCGLCASTTNYENCTTSAIFKELCNLINLLYCNIGDVIRFKFLGLNSTIFSGYINVNVVSTWSCHKAGRRRLNKVVSSNVKH